MESTKETCEEDFRVYRFEYIKSMFEFLATAQDMDADIGKILEHLENSDLTRVCSSCGTLYRARKLLCDHCKGSVVAREISNVQDDNEDGSVLPKYFNVGEVNLDNRTHISMGEPVLVNPNSYQNIKIILDKLKERYIKEGSGSG